MDHFVSLVVIVCVVVIAVSYQRLHARAKIGRMEFEVRVDRSDKKEKPGRNPDSSSN